MYEIYLVTRIIRSSGRTIHFYFSRSRAWEGLERLRPFLFPLGLVGRFYVLAVRNCVSSITIQRRIILK